MREQIIMLNQSIHDAVGDKRGAIEPQVAVTLEWEKTRIAAVHY